MARPSGRQHATSETFSYYPDGTIKTWTTRDGVVIRYTSDPGNRMIAAVPALAAGMALASSMAPLDGGERLARRSTFRLCEARVQAHTPELISGMGWSFALDAGQRLAGAFAGAGSLRESDSQESFERFRFAYGEGDGLSRMVREGAGEAVGFEVGVGGRIASRGGVAYLYDRSGRRVEDERFSYVWDWRGRLVQVDIKPGSGVRDASGRLLEGHRILYEHDALGRLLHRIHLGPLPQGERDEAKRPFVAKTRFFWEGNRLLAEEGLNFQGGLLWRKSYLSGPQRLDDVVQIKVETFAASDPTKPTSVRVYTVLKDELGSVVGLVEERAGSSPERPPMPVRYLYTPYAEAHWEVGPEVREVRFDKELTAVVTDGGTVTRVVADEGKAAKGGLRITMALPVDAATLGEGVMVEKLVPGEGWKPVSQSEVVVAPTRAPPDHTAQDLPPGIDILALAGWPRGASFRVRLTQALADLAGRPLAEEQSVVWSIPEGRDEVVFAQTFPVSYDTIQAASDTLGGAIPGGQTLLFHGLWTDPATGLAYARNRWYDPRTASWLSEDPLRDLDSPNLYAYVSWQPQMYRDPMGTCRWNDWECWGWVAEEFGKNIVTDPNAQSTALGFTPVVGDIKDWQEAITGVDLITGERLAWWERGATVVAGLAPVVSGKGLRELAGLKKLADQPALPPGRVAKALPAGHAPKALPGWKLPVAYDPRVKRWRDLQTGQFTKPPIVIGENMERVREYARQIGAQTIEDFVTEWSFGANREWIRQMKAEGRQVIDTGPDFARRVERLEKGKVPWSDVYNMERMELKGYGNYKRVFRRFGKWRGGVPGLDKS